MMIGEPLCHLLEQSKIKLKKITLEMFEYRVRDVMVELLLPGRAEVESLLPPVAPGGRRCPWPLP